MIIDVKKYCYVFNL